MEYVNNTLDFKITEPCAISLGKFDGLHAGHRYLMEEMEQGKKEGLKCVVFTFDIPPKALGGGDYSLLSTNEEKARIFAARGIDYLIECPFTDEIRQMSPRDFLGMLTKRIHVKKIVAGTDFRFGYRRSGTYEDLQRLAPEFGYEAVIVQKKQYRGEDISSTRIRACIAAGDMEEANVLLGYSYFLSGRVLHGNEIGRTIGVPTANLLPPVKKLLPPNGVYAVRVKLSGETFYGISNIGCKPTVEGNNPVGVETHIFDFSGDIYGEEIVVSFLKYIRSERKFASIGELRAQMERDMAQCRSFISGLADF